MRIRVGMIVLGVLVLSASPARAQMSMSGGRSLGGYGASSVGSYYASGGGGYVPYMGNGSGFVPYRSGQGGGMGVQPARRQLPQTSIGGAMMAETPIGGASLSPMAANAGTGRAMSMTAYGSAGRGLGIPFGYEGGIGNGGMEMPSTGQRGSMRPGPGPGFGYPFRMPAPLPGSPSMSMP